MAHILIVEDEKSINDLIAMNLSMVGHTSEQAYEGNEALLYIKQLFCDIVQFFGVFSIKWLMVKANFIPSI